MKMGTRGLVGLGEETDGIRFVIAPTALRPTYTERGEQINWFVGGAKCFSS